MKAMEEQLGDTEKTTTSLENEIKKKEKRACNFILKIYYLDNTQYQMFMLKSKNEEE
jgi:hypothetical protein